MPPWGGWIKDISKSKYSRHADDVKRDTGWNMKMKQNHATPSKPRLN